MLADVLATRDVTIPAGWTLTSATVVAARGSFVSITGDGTNPNGDDEAWLARICQ